MPDGEPSYPGEMPRVAGAPRQAVLGPSGPPDPAAALPDAETGRGEAPGASGIVGDEVAALREEIERLRTLLRVEREADPLSRGGPRAESALLREQNALLWDEVVRLRELARQPWWDPQRVTTSGTHSTVETASSAARCFTCGASSAVQPHSCGKSSL